ncbi:MAG: hypothetical protein CMN30_30320 [Sandaracinus sp.]|nr:hypothetical protein [Sandaracinus sp.]
MTRASILLLALLVACATIGDETDFPGPLQTSGVGPFRLLDEAETGTEFRPDARLVRPQGAYGRAMVAGDRIFYDLAPVVDDVPDRAEGLPEGDIDLAQVGPFTIRRGARVAGDDAAPFGFEPGAEVLAATETWEGDSLRDPWAVESRFGAQLYYAAAGGIGMAAAAELGGTFTKAAGPLVEDARAPSVVEWEGELLLFFEATDTGTLGLARSTDGSTFTVETRELPLALAGEGALAAPGAVVAPSPTGRSILRVYFEVFDAEGVRLVSMAGTDDLSTWDRLETGVLGVLEDARGPTPVLLEDYVTVLVATAPFESRGVQLRAPVGAVAPSSARLAPEAM